MGVDQDGQHAKGFVVFDETHAAHVGRKIVDQIDTVDRALTRLLIAKIELQVFRFGEHLKPFPEWFYVDRPDCFSLAEQISYQMAADKSAAPANYDFFRFHLAQRAPTSPALYRERAPLQPGADCTPSYAWPEREPPKNQSRIK